MAIARFAFGASLFALGFFIALRAEPAPDSGLLEAARTYAGWGRVDDMNRWMPGLCSYQPGQSRLSASDDALTHGRKLYLLFARHRDAYMAGGVQADGQTIVKEGWIPKPVGSREQVHERIRERIYGKERDRGDAGELRSLTLAADVNGEMWAPSRRMGLFLMHKSGGEWSYAVATPDGTRLLDPIATSTCRGCHDSAKPDRLFGPPR